MTAEYLDRSSLVARMKYYEEHTTEESGEHYAYSVALREIRNAPAADVAEVVHGEWLRADDDWNSLTTIQCSLCSEEWCFETDDDVSLLNYKYCPNCGAKMDGGFDDATS